MTDTSKIRPGDTGLIRVRFESLASSAVMVSFPCSSPLKGVTIPIDIIASHEPAPWVPEPKDVVRDHRNERDCEVVAVDSDVLWIKPLSEPSDTGRLSHRVGITLIRKGAA